ncbi:MAG TPA: hypothetical protein VFL93_15665 [Longimicrobiaceae bacterium]|nr:hypothetical protein [Longimicrobiaceae bacterium]
MTLLILLAVAVAYAYQNANRLADWYAAFAWQHLPPTASSFAPVPSASGAYFYCAREVVHRMKGDLSVETFPDEGQAHTTTVGENAFRVEAFVDQATGDGTPARFEFTCRVHFDDGRWALDDLQLQPLAASR